MGEDLAVAVEGEENQLSDDSPDNGPRRNFTTNLRLANLDLANFRLVDGFLADLTAEYLLEPTLAVGFFVGSLISELNSSLVDPTAPAAPNNSPDGHASFCFCVKTEERRYSLTTPLGWFRNSSLKQKPFCDKKLFTCFFGRPLKKNNALYRLTAANLRSQGGSSFPERYSEYYTQSGQEDMRAPVSVPDPDSRREHTYSRVHL